MRISIQYNRAFSLTFFAYASKMNLQPNINFLANVYHFIHHSRTKTTTIDKRGVKQIITNEYKGRFYNDYVEVICFIKHEKENKESVTDVVNKTEDLLSKCSEQAQVNPLLMFPSKVITTDAEQTLFLQTFYSESYYPVRANVSCIYALENLENVTIFEFSGVRERKH